MRRENAQSPPRSRYPACCSDSGEGRPQIPRPHNRDSRLRCHARQHSRSGFRLPAFAIRLRAGIYQFRMIASSGSRTPKAGSRYIVRMPKSSTQSPPRLLPHRISRPGFLGDHRPRSGTRRRRFGATSSITPAPSSCSRWTIPRATPRVLLERQYRHAASDYLWELPAGRIDPGEQELQAAKRELMEETGYTAAKWRRILKFYASPGFVAETMSVYPGHGPARRRGPAGRRRNHLQAHGSPRRPPSAWCSAAPFAMPRPSLPCCGSTTRPVRGGEEARSRK